MAARRNLSDVLGLPEAAKFLGVSRQAIWLAIKEGRLKARKIGNTFIVHRETLTEYQSSKRPPGRPKKPPKTTKKNP